MDGQLRGEQMETEPKSSGGGLPVLAARPDSRWEIPLKDLQEIYDAAYASQMIPTPVTVRNVMDYTLLDEVLKERK